MYRFVLKSVTCPLNFIQVNFHILKTRFCIIHLKSFHLIRLIKEAHSSSSISTFPILLFFHPFYGIGQNKSGVVFIAEFDFIGPGIQGKSPDEVPATAGVSRLDA